MGITFHNHMVLVSYYMNINLCCIKQGSQLTLAGLVVAESYLPHLHPSTSLKSPARSKASRVMPTATTSPSLIANSLNIQCGTPHLFVCYCLQHWQVLLHRKYQQRIIWEGMGCTIKHQLSWYVTWSCAFHNILSCISASIGQNFLKTHT